MVLHVLEDDNDDNDDDDDEDHLLSLGIFDEHKNANQRRAIRMTKAKRTGDMSGGEVRSGS